MTTRAFRLPALVTAAVLIASAVFTAPVQANTVTAKPATASATDDKAVASAIAAYRTAYPQMSESAARAAFDQQLTRKNLQLQVSANAAYGGSWFDAPSGVMHLSLTSPAAASEALKTAQKLGIRAEAHVVKRSWADLERLATSLQNNSVAKASNGVVGIDVKSNTVTLAVSGQNVSAVRAQGVPAGVTVVTGSNLERELDAGCTSRLDCDWTIRAGAILKYNGSPVCSVGFTARTSAGQRYSYTAGHCNSGGGTWSTGAQAIGPMTGAIVSGGLDAGIIRNDNPWFQYDAGGEIYIESGSRTMALNYVAPTMGYLLVGETVCLAANYTSPNGPNRCGIIGSTNDGGMVRVDGLDACGGDSGGGWYWLGSATYRVAYGIHSQSHYGCNGDQGGSQSWFSPIPQITPLWGLAIETRAS
ncbi:S1 family peptidase [Micromonospora sp. NPDC004704]